jgi:hypothetical protein
MVMYIEDPGFRGRLTTSETRRLYQRQLFSYAAFASRWLSHCPVLHYVSEYCVHLAGRLR